ncbi:MAG: hypothetical protein PVF33_05880 [Candidatus Latescibacterota bacterium]|jgi:hypothetical protein
MTGNDKAISEVARGVLATTRKKTRGLVRAVLRFKNARLFSQSGGPRVAGFTLIEIAFACEVIMLLTLIGFNETRRVKEHARVAACLQYQASFQRALWGEYALTGDFPVDEAAVLASMPNCSIGNDFEYKGGIANGLFGEYYLRCSHDHSYVGVLFVDSGAYLPPKPIYNLATARGNI